VKTIPHLFNYSILCLKIKTLSQMESTIPVANSNQAVQVCVRIRPCGVNTGDAAYEGNVVDHDDHYCTIEGERQGPFSAIIPPQTSQDSVY